MKTFAPLLLLSLAALGCAPQGPSDDDSPTEVAHAPERAEEVKGQADRIRAAESEERLAERSADRKLTEPEGEQRFEKDTESAHRARTFYLIGVRFLGERPPRGGPPSPRSWREEREAARTQPTASCRRLRKRCNPATRHGGAIH